MRFDLIIVLSFLIALTTGVFIGSEYHKHQPPERNWEQLLVGTWSFECLSEKYCGEEDWSGTFEVTPDLRWKSESLPTSEERETGEAHPSTGQLELEMIDRDVALLKSNSDVQDIHNPFSRLESLLYYNSDDELGQKILFTLWQPISDSEPEFVWRRVR